MTVPMKVGDAGDAKGLGDRAAGAASAGRPGRDHRRRGPGSTPHRHARQLSRSAAADDAVARLLSGQRQCRQRRVVGRRARPHAPAPSKPGISGSTARRLFMAPFRKRVQDRSVGLRSDWRRRPAGNVARSSPRASMASPSPSSKRPALKAADMVRQPAPTARRASYRAQAAVGDDLDGMLGQQQVDQHAVVVFGVPDPQLAEHGQRRSRAAVPRHR